MKIDMLQLMAFGPFTGTVLDLSQGGQGFHIVYGPNEAGKSSALRALRQLLYGIPERSDDNFLHPYAKMRIGAVLETTDGRTLDIIRRKGRTGTLRAADDTTLVEESLLQQFLQGVDADLFATMFGISHQDLVQGGKDIIQGGGDVGQLIFSAGSGIANLREIQNELQSKADELFRPAGQKPKINEALNFLRMCQKQQREAQLTGQEWVRHDEALRKAETLKESVLGQLAELEKERSRLQRIDEALPYIARHRELSNELIAYAGAVLLPQDFREQRRELQMGISSVESRKNQAQKRIESLSREIVKLDPDPGLLENSEMIEALHRESGSQRKAATDRIALESRSKALLNDAKDILSSLRDDLTIEQAESLRIKKTEAVKIQKLSTNYERIHTRLEDARSQLPELDRDIAGLDNELAGLAKPRPIEKLRTALAEASEYGPLEKHCRTEQIEIDTTAHTMAFEQKGLGLDNQNPDDVERLVVPLFETLRVFEERFDTAAHRMADLEAGTKKAQAALADVRRQIEAYRLEQEVPTEKDLQQARTLRNRGWNLIAATLDGQAPPEEEIQEFIKTVSSDSTLSNAFETTMNRADDVSDRLRREADRVVTKARLLADQANIQEQMNQLKSEHHVAAERSSARENEWIALWRPSGITPRTPREMSQWHRSFRTLTEKIEELRNRRLKTESLRQDIEAHRQTLMTCLLELGEPEPSTEESLTGLIKRADSIMVREQQIFQTRSEIERDKFRKEKDRAAAIERIGSNEADLKTWQSQWEEAVSPIGLDADAYPEEAGVVIEALNNLFEKLREAGILKKRMEGIDRDADQFASKVKGLARVVAADLSRRSADEILLELHQRLKRAMEASAQKETLQKQLAQEEKIFTQAIGDRSRIDADISVMCNEAKCKRPEDLPEAEQLSERRRAIESELQTLDGQLRRLSAGATVESFIKETIDIDPDTITGKISQLEESIDRLNSEKSDLDQSIGSERTELNKMDGTSRAAALAEEIQTTLGGLENCVEDYARFKIAAKVLSMAIERYRDRSQGPILSRASELFRQITGDSFKGLRAEFDSAGQPVIVGVRTGNSETVTVDGMSDGTADQLYLALRLAGLEMYLEKNEPLPFVVDDILIMFDNDRATATLKVLEELSTKTQVIFFTHHRHLVDMAERNIDSSILFKTELGR